MLMPFMTTVPCRIYRYTGSDIYNTPQYDLEHPIDTVCSMVDTRENDDKTTVRVDSSATKGNAREQSFEVRMLIPKSVRPNIQDRIIADGFDMKIFRVSPRRNVFGELDHYEIRCEHGKLKGSRDGRL